MTRSQEPPLRHVLRALAGLWLALTAAAAPAAEPVRQPFAGSCEAFVGHVRRVGVQDALGANHPQRAAVTEFIYTPQVGNLVVYPFDSPELGYRCDANRIVYDTPEQCQVRCPASGKAAACEAVPAKICYLARIGKRPAMFQVSNSINLLDWRPRRAVSDSCLEEKRDWENEVLALEQAHLDDRVQPVLKKYNQVWNARSPHVYQACGATRDEAQKNLLDAIQIDLKQQTEKIRAEVDALIEEYGRGEGTQPAPIDCSLCGGAR